MSLNAFDAIKRRPRKAKVMARGVLVVAIGVYNKFGHEQAQNNCGLINRVCGWQEAHW